MEKAKIDRINALAAKKNAVGLTPEELAEQKALREEYLTEFHAAIRGKSDERVVLASDGSKKVVKTE